MLLLASILLIAAGSPDNQCEGKENAPYLSAGYVELGARVLGAAPPYEFAVSLACRRDNSRWTLFLLKDMNAGMARTPNWVTRALLTIPRPDPGFTVACHCFLGEQKDSELIAVVRESNSSRFSVIRRAWRADRRRELFVEVPTTNISCVNELNEQ